MRKLKLGFGGHPLKNDDFVLMQDSYIECLKAIISIFDPSLNIILSGFIITDDGTNISCTEGYVSWLGEIYKIDQTTFAKVSGGQLYLNLLEIVEYPSPVTYKDQTIQNVHINRKLQLKYFTSGDTGEYLAAFTRTSSLGFKQGMMLDFIGNPLNNFDEDGLGINQMAGFAIANGNTYTVSGGILYTVPDLRGRSRIGASNVPSQGAPIYDGTILSNPTITEKGGRAFITLLKENLPNYNFTITDNGHIHFSVVNETFASNNFPYEVNRQVTNARAMVQGYNKASGSGKESYYFAGSGTTPTLSPTSNGKSSDGLIVNSGGSSLAFDNRGAWYACIPIIKL